MKRKLVALLAGITLISATAAFAACGGSSASIIHADAATNIALANAGLTETECTTTVYTEEKNGVTYYRVNIVIDNVTFSYRINAESGEIVNLTINDQTVSTSDVPTSPSNTATYIGIDAAPAIALADAGCTAADVTSLKAELDYDDGQYLYEVDFTYNGTRYEYEIVATDGSIYKKEIDDVTVVYPSATESGSTLLTTEEAKAIALADAGLSDATFTKVSLDREKGVQVYDIEFYTAEAEYEYEINAATGVIISKEIDGKYASQSGTESGAYIGTSNALAIALAHAGLSASDSYLKECRLERDRGVYLYEIEFVANGYEYEYEVNATTGAILKAEKEWDD